MHLRSMAIAALVTLGLGGAAQASQITPDIIFGSGNTNRGFEVVTEGSLELGIRAKRRYPANDAIGNGIVRDSAGRYLFDSSASTAGTGQSVWSYDWSINSSFDGNGGGLDTFRYLISLDTDPTISNAFTINYDPLSALSTGYYLGTNATGNGAASFEGGGDDDFTNNNVAQNSVQPQWVGGSIDPGQYGVRLSAFDLTTDELVASVTIQSVLDAPAPIPLPAGGLLLLGGLGGLGLLRRRRQRG